MRAASLLLALVLLSPAAGLAAAISVTTSSDAGGAGCTCLVTNSCTLRQALACANPGDVVNLCAPGAITLTQGQLSVSQNQTIRADPACGLPQAVSGNDTYRVLEVTAGTVVIDGVSMTDGIGYSGTVHGEGGALRNAGTLTLKNLNVADSGAAGGGGIYNSGSMALDTVVVSGNSINTGANGGGILHEGTTLTVTDSVITANDTRAVGGGIAVLAGMASLERTRFVGNFSGSHGGAVYADDQADSLGIEDCSFSQNISTFAGGGVSSAVNTTISGSTFSSNQARTDGGGLDLWGVDTALVINSTFSGNQAYGHGGGVIMSAWSTGGLSFVTITGNTADFDCGPGGTCEDGNGGGIYVRGGSAQLTGVLVAGNQDNSVATIHPDMSVSTISSPLPTVTSLGGNLLAIIRGANNYFTVSPAGSPNAQGDWVGTLNVPIDPKLGPLTDNGGLTLTHALLADSPAINQGPSPCDDVLGFTIIEDQRGAHRPQRGRADIGAYEAPGCPVAALLPLILS